MKSRTLTTGTDEINLVEDPQLTVQFDIKNKVQSSLKQENQILNVLSLFSGCGGMDLGFEGDFSVSGPSVNEILTPNFIEKKLKNGHVLLKKTRFRTIFSNDIFTEARNAWVNYFSKRGLSPDRFFTDSIVDLVNMHKSGHSVFPRNVDVVTGGFPCQDFSVSGKRNGFNSHKNHKGELIGKNSPSVETRGQLYMWMKEVIDITQPKIFIAENVKGLVNLSNVKAIIQKDFSSASGNGYIVLNPEVLHSADYGVPQSRQRVIFIGIKKSALTKRALEELSREFICDNYNPYPKKTHAFTTEGNGLKPFVTLQDIFYNLKEPEETDDLSQKYYSKAKFMGVHCQGQTEIKLSKIGPTIRAEHHGNIEFRRLSKLNGGKLDHEINQGLKERRLTPRECGLIQTFPADYEFVIEKKGGKGAYLVSPSKAYKIIGNAVPPLLAYNLARRIEELWDLYFKK